MNRNYVAEFQEIFNEIKSNNPHKSLRKSDTGIGYTFEELMNITEDNLSLPDFGHIEIKSKDRFSSALLTLFTKSPDFPRGANSILRDNFGKDVKGNKELHTTISANKFNSFQSDGTIYNFKLTIDYDNKRILINTKENNINVLDEAIGWHFSTLEDRVREKLQTIALVTAERDIRSNGDVYYSYIRADLLTGFNFERLLIAIENGELMIDIRIGAYKSGVKRGNTHDHGTAFRINKDNFYKYVDVSEFC